MNNPAHPSLRCQAHWQNTQSQRYAQILPKSLPARPTPTHGGQDSAVKMEDKLNEKINNETPTSAVSLWKKVVYLLHEPRLIQASRFHPFSLLHNILYPPPG